MTKIEDFLKLCPALLDMSYRFARNVRGFAMSTKADDLINVTLSGDAADVRELLKNGAMPNLRGIAGWTALLVASDNNFREVVQVLLDGGPM